MSRKPENNFIDSVHKHLLGQVYAEKMYNPLRGGTPDVYYEAGKHLWVEYKFIELPKRANTLVKANLSPLQAYWLARSFKNNGQARVVLGWKDGGVMFNSPEEWCTAHEAGELVEIMVRRDELARQIERLIL